MIVYAAETPLYMFFLTGSRTVLWISVEFLRMGRYFTTYMNLNETSYTYLNFWQHSITKGECYRAQCVESSEDLSCSVSLKTVTDFLSVDLIPIMNCDTNGCPCKSNGAGSADSIDPSE